MRSNSSAYAVDGAVAGQPCTRLVQRAPARRGVRGTGIQRTQDETLLQYELLVNLLTLQGGPLFR